LYYNKYGLFKSPFRVTFAFSAKKPAQWYHLAILKGRVLQISLHSTNDISGVACKGTKRNIILIFLEAFFLLATFIVAIRRIKRCKLLGERGNILCSVMVIVSPRIDLFDHTGV